MKQKYTFFDGGTIEFDDKKTVKELLTYAFRAFGFYEPFGMEIVTVFQAHHPDTYSGWFTTDVNRKCAREIKNPKELCFAYHMPGVFYYAEGGWGHHMTSLGNHPTIPHAVALNLRMEDFDHTVVVNGDYLFRDIIELLKNAGYLSRRATTMKVFPAGCSNSNYYISFSDSLMELPLTDFLEEIDRRSQKIQEETGLYIYYNIFDLS